VFGRVVDGMETVVRKMEYTKTGPNDRPVQNVLVEDCGQL
jgi:cyclophilin family peptidyl-prolyl cis-trans isomerase